MEVANSVIRNNKGRKEKTLWTDNEKGEKIRLRQFDTAYDEAQFIAEDIKDETAQGANYSDHAVLYRTNAQSRLLEEKFVAMNIPYKIVGGINFYSRREIKDVLSYLKTIDNGKDDLAVRRIINVPKRGIGLTTINRIQESAAARGIGFYDALSAPDLIPGIGRSASKLDSFAALIEYFKGRSEESGVTDLLTEVIEKTGYTESLEADDPEELEARVQNIDELVSKAARATSSRKPLSVGLSPLSLQLSSYTAALLTSSSIFCTLASSSSGSSASRLSVYPVFSITSVRRSAYAQKPAFAAIQKGSGLMAKKSEGLSYGVGDRVRHVKFGDGTVTEIKEGGRDYEVTVQFDTAGVRKMFALFAKLIKI